MNIPRCPGGELITRRVIGFARMVRENGLTVGLRESVDALRLLGELDLLDAGSFRAGLRSLFCSCYSDWGRFDELFEAYWRGSVTGHGVSVGRGPGASSGTGQPTSGNDSDLVSDAHENAAGSAATCLEKLSRTDFRHLDDPKELAKVFALSDRLAARMRRRLTRRCRLRRRGRTLDIRKTIHRSLPYGGTPLNPAFRSRRVRPVRLVVFLDASGSMSSYTTFFMRFIRGVLRSFDDAQAFLFHTRLVHVSGVLKERDIDKALEKMNLLSAGVGGGTRLGESLATFNSAYAREILNSRSVIVVVSDGYDTGSPEELACQLKRLRGRAKRVIWLNPLLGWRGYEPLAKGMLAALPFVDLFAPAHNLESLAALEQELCAL